MLRGNDITVCECCDCFSRVLTALLEYIDLFQSQIPDLLAMESRDAVIVYIINIMVEDKQSFY